jgi:hypothetical protein
LGRAPASGAALAETIFRYCFHALLAVTILFVNAGAKFWKIFNHESATAEKFPGMNTNGENRRGTTDYTDVTNTWEKSASHEIHGSPESKGPVQKN